MESFDTSSGAPQVLNRFIEIVVLDVSAAKKRKAPKRARTLIPHYPLQITKFRRRPRFGAATGQRGTKALLQEAIAASGGFHP